MEQRHVPGEAKDACLGGAESRGSGMTREQAIRRASQLAEFIAPRAAETEERRRLADETVAEIVNSGLVEALVPERWGGAGLDWDTLVDTSAEIGKVCGST